MTAQAFDQRNVTYAQPENEAIGIGLAQGLLRRGGGNRIAPVNIGDSRGYHNVG
jgi:hypothetical protein